MYFVDVERIACEALLLWVLISSGIVLLVSALLRPFLKDDDEETDYD